MLLFKFLWTSCYKCRFNISKSFFCALKATKSGEIMKVLNVAEKNDAAKNIATILSNGQSNRREGLSKFNKIYEFNIQLWNQNCKMLMTSVSGHLLGYEFVGEYRKWQGCHPLSLFDAPVVKQCSDENYQKIKRTLEKEVTSCNALIIWTDCDREGENIGFEVIQVCTAIKPSIRIYRAKFSEITRASMNRALQTLGEPIKAISDAVDVRSELDLRIGAAFTRFQTLRLQRVFPQTLADMLISYGSCQFPTLGFVVERYLAIQRFVPEPYWKIKVMDTRDDISVEFRWARFRLFEELPCQVILDMCQENPDATVKEVTTKPKSKWRPLPLDTIELEKQGSRKLKLTAKETMKIAERLYTQGLISYPRTETNIFPKELNLVPLVEQQTNHPAWGDFARRLINDGVTPRQGKKSDQAHPPIHPTKFTNQLQGNDAKVYEFVVRHFLACVSKDAQGFETQVTIDIANEIFHASGLQIVAKNYLEVYIYEKWSSKEIHMYQEGQVFRPTSIEMLQEETSPPKLLTEADLIALMDKHGIGTDATHAEHIDTIKSRQYVGLRDNIHFVPGKLGIGLVMGYDNMGFQMSKPNLRAELESDLKAICEGQKDPKEVLKIQIDKYREVFRVALARANLIDAALAEYLDERPLGGIPDIEMTNVSVETTILKCPKCGSNMTLKTKRQGTGKFIGCMAFPTCNNAIWLPSSVEDVEVLEETCNRCPGNLRKLKFKLKALPLYGTSYITCIGGCDEMFNEVLEIRLDSVRRTNRANDSGYGSSNGSTTSQSNPHRSAQTNLQRSAPNSRITVSSQRASSSQNRNNTARSQSSDRGANARSTSNTRPPSSSQPSWQNHDENVVVQCNCHEPAIQLTVRKEGPNQGRLFYKCAKPQGTGCNYFLWASDVVAPGPSNSRNNISNSQNTRMNFQNRSNNNAQTHQSSFNNSNSDAGPSSDDVVCSCGNPARKLTVQKQGPNTGRQFYTCPNAISNKCNFFKWADEADSGGFAQSQPGPSRGNPNRGQDRGSSRKPRATGGKRKCGVCGVEGHTRKTCTENAFD